MVEGKNMDTPKKYWWAIGIAVPIIVAIISVIPQLTSTDVEHESFYVDVVGTQFNGKIAFNNVTVIQEQALGKLGEDLSKDTVDKLHQALKLASDKKFDQAISAFESIAKIVSVPAVYNNLGAAHLGSGNKAQAKDAFNKALSEAPEQATAQFNLQLTNSKYDNDNPVSTEIKSTISSEIEPNNKILNPNIIPLDTWITGVKSDSNDNDFFKFTTAKTYRDIVRVSIENLSTTLKPLIKVYNSEKSDISGWQGNETSGANLHYTIVAAPNTSYYFLVSSHHKTIGKYKTIIKPLECLRRI